MVSQIFKPRGSDLRAGYTTLEFAVALPMVLVVLFGAIDLTALVQGYAALREGVRQSVRCVATTDGRCIGVSRASAIPLFHWYQLNGSPGYSADRLDIRGHGYWLKQPTYAYTEARVLDAAHYAVPVTDYTAKRWVYPTSRELRYNIRESRGAYVTGSSSRSPNFVFKNAPTIPYPSDVIVSHRVEEEISLARPRITIAVPFNEPLPDIPCYRSNALDAGPNAEHRPSTATCNPNRVPAIVFVRGAARGHGHGDLTLSIDGRHITNTDFGGQRFDIDSAGWQSRNFIPRGVAPGYVDRTFNGEPEYALYAEAITVARGETVSVTVSIAPGANSWTDPTMRYRVTEVRIIPAIVRTIETTVACDEGVTRGDFLRGISPDCPLPYPPGAIGSTLVDTTRNQDTSPPRTLSAILSEAHLENSFATAGLDRLDYVTESSATRVETRKNPCPENVGVPYPADPAGFVTAPETTSICPMIDPVLTQYGIVPHSMKWSERTISLPPAARFHWRKRDCAHEESLPEALVRYPKPVRTSVEHDFFPEPPETPRADRYRCPEFPLQHMVFDDMGSGGSVPLPTHSAFLGLQPERVEGCLLRELKHDAVTNGGLDPRAYFETETKRVDAVYLPGAPTDSCAVYRTDLGAPTGRTLLTAGSPLPSGERPTECSTTPCVAEFQGLSAGSPGEATADTHHAAAYWGYNEVRSLYPRARWDCSGAECVALEIADGENEVVGRGRITVPVRLLLGQAVDLTFVDRRRKETSFAP